jgi:Mce-associated membrane protein
MAEHADPSHEEVSEIEKSTAAPPSPGPTDEASSRNGVGAHDADTREPSAAEPASHAEEAEDYDAAVDGKADDGSEQAEQANEPMSPVRLATVIGLVMVVGLAVLAGWLGFRNYQSHQAQQQRALLVQVGRQGALDLTTIDWQHADGDIQRILDSATGTFYDDFSKRSKPFIELVKKVQSKSVGTITESGLESQSGEEAQVLVAVSVNTSTVGGAEPEPRHWRMRITVHKDGDEAKVSNVAFVP